MQNRVFLCLTLFVLAALTSIGQPKETNYHRVKISSSSITIFGETNINRFDCTMNQPAHSEQIVVKNIWSNSTLEFEGLQLGYGIREFDCGMAAMNNDFQELLKADKAPSLFLQLNSITLHNGNTAFEELNVEAEINIVIAGVTKTITSSQCKVFNHSEAHLTLKGSKELFMTDFDINPPVKFFGMIKVKDKINVEFEIEMLAFSTRIKKPSRLLSGRLSCILNGILLETDHRLQHKSIEFCTL